MKDYATLKALIEQRGVHEQLGPTGEGVAIEQNPHELATFLVRMQELGVQSVLEIGTGYKAGLARFLAHEMGCRVTTVDVRDYGHTFEGIEFVILDDIGHWVFPWGNGHARHSIASVQRNKRFDLVFIDGNHSYESVSYDYLNYNLCATKAIAFHDIEGLRECQGARRFWWEIKVKHSLDDNVKMWWSIDDTPQCAGIGWIEL